MAPPNVARTSIPHSLRIIRFPSRSSSYLLQIGPNCSPTFGRTVTTMSIAVHSSANSSPRRIPVLRLKGSLAPNDRRTLRASATAVSSAPFASCLQSHVPYASLHQAPSEPFAIRKTPPHSGIVLLASDRGAERRRGGSRSMKASQSSPRG